MVARNRCGFQRRNITRAGHGLLAALVAAAVCPWAWGQAPGHEEAEPCPPAAALPMVPLKAPRPAEAPGQKFLRNPDAAPTASFIDSLRGNDAAFEVILGQGRLLTLRGELAGPRGRAVVAVGDPSVVQFEMLPNNSRMIRLIGRRAGLTDISITSDNGETYSLEVRVLYDLDLMRAQLRQFFPDTELRLAQMREHLVVEGQARSPEQVAQIVRTLEAFLTSAQVPMETKGEAPTGDAGPGGDRGGQRGGAKTGRPAGTSPQARNNGGDPGAEGEQEPSPEGTSPEARGSQSTKTSFPKPQLINLIRVPGVHQVMLQVRIAELNRTGLREIGADFLKVFPKSGNIIGTNIAGGSVSALGLLGLGGLTGTASGQTGANTTSFGVFPSGDFELLIRALRKNSLASIMAEPNLMAMSGQRASFLAGGQFPVPVPQGGGAGFNNVTVEWKDFGVQLEFIPSVMDDETIRLQVKPEVSTIDFRLGTVLVVGGTPVPGLNTRKANTTVELRPGQTLAIAGLLNVEIAADTARIPGLGDLPYIGTLFSNNSHERREKELLVLVTPQLVSPMEPHQVGPLPTDCVMDPNDLEFYFLGRIEGRTGREFSSPRSWEDPLGLSRTMRLERRTISGPVGFSE